MNNYKSKLINDRIRNIRGKDRLDKLTSRLLKEASVLKKTEAARKESLMQLRGYQELQKKLGKAIGDNSWDGMVTRYEEVMGEGRYLHQRVEHILIAEGKLRASFTELRKELELLRTPPTPPFQPLIAPIPSPIEPNHSVDETHFTLYRYANNLSGLLAQVNRADRYRSLGAQCTFTFADTDVILPSKIAQLSLLLGKKLENAYEFAYQRKARYISRHQRLPSLALSRTEDKHSQGNTHSKRFSPQSFQALQAMAGSYASLLHRDILQHRDSPTHSKDTKQGIKENTDRQGTDSRDIPVSERFQSKSTFAKRSKALSLPQMDIKSLQPANTKISTTRDHRIIELKAYVNARKRDLIRGESNAEFSQFTRQLAVRKRDLQRFIDSSSRPHSPVSRPLRFKANGSSLPTTACASPNSSEMWRRPQRFQGKSAAERLAQLFC